MQVPAKVPNILEFNCSSNGHAPPMLVSDAIHLWLGRLGEPGDPGVLNAHERARADALRDPRRRSRFVSARTQLRKTLSCYVGCAPKDVALAVAPGGRPVLIAQPHSSALAFSLSHSGDALAIAVSRHAIGVDVEILRPVRSALAIARRYLDANAATALENCEPENRDLIFLSAWTKIEAACKSTGWGWRGRKSVSNVPTLTLQRDDLISSLAFAARP
jgi:4'-phosphopantetheinyl transferase